MDVYYDSEFIDTGNQIGPISIGFVDDHGKELYRIWNDRATINGAVHNPWLRENVVPSLPITVLDPANWEWDERHPDFNKVQPINVIRRDIEDWLLRPGEPITLWAWYAAYDHVLLAQIWGRMLQLPPGIPMFTCDLKQEHVRLGEPELPKQAKGVHNALADARHNRVVHEFLKRYEREQ